MPDEQKKTDDKTDDFKEKWDTEKQRADQEHANYEKATAKATKIQAEKDTVAEELRDQLEKVAKLEGQLKAKTETTDYPELDPDLVDKNVIKTVIQMKANLKAEQEKVAILEGKAAGYEKAEQQRVAKEYRDDLIEKICKPLDEEYGVQHRNAAKKLADELVEKREEKEPKDTIDVMNLMRKCYKQVVEKDKSKDTKDIVRTDAGGGGTATSAVAKKTGTTEEVLADMKTDKSWME